MVRKLLRKIKKIVRINWIKSAYINFRVLPIEKAIKFPIIVTGKVRIKSLNGKIIINGNVRFGLVNIGKDVDNMPISILPAQLMIKGVLILNGDVILNQSANLVVWPNAIMELGNDVMICSGVTLKAVNKVTVGNHVMISSGCFIMDSSIHCIYNTEDMSVASPNGEIHIGNNVWLNMYTDVIKWGQVPDGCITARYTFINKPLDTSDENCFLAGQPARVIKRNLTQLHNLSSERVVTKFYKEHNEFERYKLNAKEVDSENLCKIL
ncbi:MAG: hypothetical protein K2K98_04520 [Muribaculaceae bacterium]|nr:hypothetical protein [Muribaculaceae bacterium]